MLSIFITALIIVILLNVFMFIVLKNISKTINKQTKSFFINKLQHYDDLIESKEQELERVSEQLEKAKKEVPVIIPISEEKETVNYDYYMDIPSYRDENFFKNYKKVKETFSVDERKIVKDFIINNHVEKNVEIYNDLMRLKSKFKSETVYNLSTLKSEEQLKIIEETLNNNDIKIIKRFQKNNGKFHVLKFIKYLDEVIIQNNPVVYIKTGNKYDNFNDINNCVKTIYDKNICSGIQIIYKNKLYDYALE